MKTKIKVFIAVLLGVLCIGGSMCVFAGTKADAIVTYTPDANSDSANYEITYGGKTYNFNIVYDYESYNKTIFYESVEETGYVYIYILQEPDYYEEVTVANNDGVYSVPKGNHSVAIATCYPSGSIGVSSNFSAAVSFKSKPTCIYADRNVYVKDAATGESQDFFQTFLAARSAAELPTVIAPVVEKVIPVAVCCLGLLIGCLVLLPKLRMYL